MATHAEINRIVNACAPFVDEVRLAAIIQTARQWQRLGLDARAIAHLVGCVPVQK